ncbi:MAG: hypothetical protein VSS75_019665 [Candidatus Parabeggiatoa sp.]|nr:hypothetical protein [Candidatus Parabeggiatoa sp.]
MNNKDTFIVDFWEKIFRFLGKISISYLIRIYFPKTINYRFVDMLVLTYLLVSIISIPLVLSISSHTIKILIAGFAMFRVFEIVIYQANVLLFDEFRAKKAGKEYAIRGYRRIVILLLHNYFEIIFWFATQYIVFNNMFNFVVAESNVSMLGAIYTSFVVMTSFGFANISPLSVLAYSIVIGQAIIGLFMTLLSLARFISLIPSPQTMDDFEK